MEHKKIQDAGQDAKFREVYDVAVARAVAEMRVLGESTLKISLFILLFMYMWFQLAFIF
jgi:16S rRNA G527 N7-methylase RsmG